MNDHSANTRPYSGHFPRELFLRGNLRLVQGKCRDETINHAGMSMVGTGDEDSLRCAAILLEEEEDEEDDSCIMSEDQDTLEQDSLEATHTSCATRLDLTDSGLERLPDSLSAFPGLEELLLGRNKLGARSHATPTGGGSNLEILARLPRLRKLLLSSNQLPLFPSALLQLNAVVHLDLSDNNIADLPQDLVELTR
uniref:Uncharacterized protein n=1 Tax=Timema monikensis TaxID=170555 RepID=A0A7R9E626_9NEOP|nr:unnamed protein product [Timema monikensis]